jgi:hypothetical protein
MIKIIYCLVLLQITTGCLTVSVQQRRVVKQFALKTGNFTSFPERIVTELAEIRETRGNYYANSFNDPETHLTELNSIVKERMNDDKIPGKVRLSFKIMDEYAAGLVQLSSDTPFKTMSELYGRFGVELETLIERYNQQEGFGHLPSGIGTLLTQSMDIGTRTYLGRRQLKELRKFVSQADTMVSVLCDDMVTFLSSDGLGRLIQIEESGISENFRFYFTKRSPPTIESEKEYVALMKKVEMVKLLQMQTIRATKNLKIAHKKLAEEMIKKKTIKEIAVQLNDYYKDVELLRGTVDALNKN